MKKQLTENEKLILDKVPLIEYYNAMIVPLSHIFKPMSENNNTGICPFHKDTDPSLHAWKKKNIFHCFGCNYGGNVIYTHQRLMSQYHKTRLDNREAVEDLGRLFNIELKEEGHEEVFNNIFEQAMYRLTNPKSIEVANPQESVVNFIKQNDRIRENEHMTLKQKINNYAELDLIYSVIVSEPN